MLLRKFPSFFKDSLIANNLTSFYRQQEKNNINVLETLPKCSIPKLISELKPFARGWGGVLFPSFVFKHTVLGTYVSCLHLHNKKMKCCDLFRTDEPAGLKF